MTRHRQAAVDPSPPPPARHPLLLELNARCWLADLSQAAGRPVDLGTVPEAELVRWRDLGFTDVWLMGVWTTGERARQQARTEPNLRRRYVELLPDWRPADVPGSPYSIAAYTVPAALGGNAGLAAFRRRLHAAGLRLILDFVPNHVGRDHPWVTEQPDLLVHARNRRPGCFRTEHAGGARWVALGRDPYFPPWADVAQVDYRNPRARRAQRQVLHRIARQCDGVRCDMAMLVLNEVFARTWASFPTHHLPPAEEFWAGAIAGVKARQPGFQFVAEAYWGREPELLALGFDHAYDKTFYDHVLRRAPGELQRHLDHAERGWLERGVRFLENHDEPRVAARFSAAEHRAALLLLLGLPGMRLLHEGQMEGRRLDLPVQLGRRPVEPPDPALTETYKVLLQGLRDSAVGRGRWRRPTIRPAWDGNPSHHQLFAVVWQDAARSFDLVIVNAAPHPSQGYVPLTEADAASPWWRLRDRLGAEEHRRSQADLSGPGLYLDVPAHAAQLFHVTPAP